MEVKKFIRTKEDFACDHCGFQVKGTGYTNHCPQCLWSKHVDVFPGDREEECKGMMRPVSGENKGGKWMIIQKCEICGREWKNELQKDDNFDVVVKLTSEAY